MTRLREISGEDILLHNMFHLPLPILEKILRPIIVYICLIAFLRLFGKRELAQLNPFDLVVLLSLSNTVQNAIIGEDNSVTGGIVGAFSMLVANWGLTRLIYRAPKLNAALEGEATVLIRDGKVDEKSLQKEALTIEELIQALSKNGYSDPEEVSLCRLEPSGTFFVKGKRPSAESVEMDEMYVVIRTLREEISALRLELRERNAS